MKLPDWLIAGLLGGFFALVVAWVADIVLGMGRLPWWTGLIAGFVFGIAYVFIRPSAPRSTGEVFHPKHDGDIPW